MRIKIIIRYGPQRGLTSSSFGGFWPRLFFLLWKKRAYYAVLAQFWKFLVSSSNLGNFKRNPPKKREKLNQTTKFVLKKIRKNRKAKKKKSKKSKKSFF